MFYYITLPSIWKLNVRPFIKHVNILQSTVPDLFMCLVRFMSYKE